MPISAGIGGSGGGGGLVLRNPVDEFTGADIAAARVARDTYFGAQANAAALAQFQADQFLTIHLKPSAGTAVFETYSPGQGGLAYDNTKWLERTGVVQGPPGQDGVDGTDGQSGDGAQRTPAEIARAIESLGGTDRLDYNALRNKLTDATPTSAGRFSAADKTKLDTYADDGSVIDAATLLGTAGADFENPTHAEIVSAVDGSANAATLAGTAATVYLDYDSLENTPDIPVLRNAAQTLQLIGYPAYSAVDAATLNGTAAADLASSGGGNLAEEVVWEISTTTSVEAALDVWRQLPEFTRALAEADRGRVMSIELKMDGFANGQFVIPVSSFLDATAVEDGDAMASADDAWSIWNVSGNAAWRRAAVAKVANNRIAVVVTHGTSTININEAKITLLATGVAAPSSGNLNLTGNLTAGGSVTAGTAIYTGGIEVVGNSTARNFDVKADSLQIGGVGTDGHRSLLFDEAFGDTTSAILQTDGTNERISVLKGPLSNPTLLALRAEKFIGDGSEITGLPLVERTIWIHKWPASLVQPVESWTRASKTTLYPTDPETEVTTATLVAANGDALDASYIDARNAHLADRSRRNMTNLRKFIAGGIEYSTSEDADGTAEAVSGASWNGANVARGNVDVHSGEYRYPYGVKIDASYNPDRVVGYDAGQGADSPIAHLLEDSVLTLTAGAWQISARFWTQGRTPLLGIFRVANDADDVVITTETRHEPALLEAGEQHDEDSDALANFSNRYLSEADGGRYGYMIAETPVMALAAETKFYVAFIPEGDRHGSGYANYDDKRLAVAVEVRKFG